MKDGDTDGKEAPDRYRVATRRVPLAARRRAPQPERGVRDGVRGDGCAPLRESRRRAWWLMREEEEAGCIQLVRFLWINDARLCLGSRSRAQVWRFIYSWA